MARPRTLLSFALGSLALTAGACAEPVERARDLGTAPSAEAPRTVVEGDYGPIAQYLVDNAVPTPQADGASEGDDGEGSTDDGAAPPADSCDGFACSDGKCIDATWRCDQITDCDGGEDEADCGAAPGGDACTGFACNDGTCIDASWKCDDYDDCAGAEDEADCGAAPGGDDGGACTGFACDDGTCIDANWACDGIVDCASGEDEAGCGLADAPGLAAGPRVQRGPAIDCIAQWTVGAAGAGVVAGEAITKACEGAGVVVGFATSGGGFAAATVCLAGDAVQIDAVVGGISGAVVGLVGGVATCQGNALVEAGDALQALLFGTSIPTYKVEDGPVADAKQCGIPLEVPLTGDAAECQGLHDDMKEFDSTHAHSCDVDIGNVGNDPAAIAAACDEIRDHFDNAAKLADLRLDIGRACYDNGDVGPMGNSDFGHQFQWCSVHQAMQKCVAQAQHAKLNCELTQTMAQHFSPAGCDNVLACQ